ncbi:MAG: CinA family protein [Chloroflexota bacterium]
MIDSPDLSGFAALARMAERVGERLRERGETIAVAESSAGGLISASLLAVSGASAYFQGGAVVYTGNAKGELLHLDEDARTKPRPATDGHALKLARAVKDRLGTTWGLGETGATGPSGNRYGDPPGHAWIGLVGPEERTRLVRTGDFDRHNNMIAFAAGAIWLLADALGLEDD